MAGSISNPRIWEGADLYVAPVGTAAPIDVDTALSAPFEPVGLLSEDGLSESRDQDSTDHYAWGSKLVRTKRSKHKRTFTVTCLEDNPTVFGLVSPGSEATTDSTSGVTTRSIVIPKSDRRAFCVEMRDGEITRRRFIPDGEVTEVGEVTMSESEMSAYQLTITVYPDSSDVLYTDIDNDPQTAVVTAP